VVEDSAVRRDDLRDAIPRSSQLECQLDRGLVPIDREERPPDLGQLDSGRKGAKWVQGTDCGPVGPKRGEDLSAGAP